MISTVAGTGSSNLAGDGYTASSAWLNSPSSIWRDSNGVVYFSDASNYRIRKIDKNNIISTFAGNYYSTVAAKNNYPALLSLFGIISGLTGDCWGNVFVADSYYHNVYKIDNSTGTRYLPVTVETMDLLLVLH